MSQVTINHHFFYGENDPLAGYFRGPTPEEFREQIRTLRSRYASNQHAMSDLFAITIDDGSRTILDIANILIEEQVDATICVCGSSLTESVLNAHKINLLRSEVGDQELHQHLKTFFPKFEFEAAPLKGSFRREQLYRYDEAETRQLKIALNYQLPPEKRDEFVENQFASIFGDASTISKRIYLGLDEIKELSNHFAIAYHGLTHATWSDLEGKQLKNETNPPKSLISLMGQNYLLSIPFGMDGSYSAQALKACNPNASGAFTMHRNTKQTIDSDGFRWIHRFDQADFFRGGQLVSELPTI